MYLANVSQEYYNYINKLTSCIFVVFLVMLKCNDCQNSLQVPKIIRKVPSMETFSATGKLHHELSLCIKFTKYGGQL